MRRWSSRTTASSPSIPRHHSPHPCSEQGLAQRRAYLSRGAQELAWPARLPGTDNRSTTPTVALSVWRRTFHGQQTQRRYLDLEIDEGRALFFQACRIVNDSRMLRLGPAPPEVARPRSAPSLLNEGRRPP